MTRVLIRGSNAQALGCSDFDRMSRKGTRKLLVALLEERQRNGDPLTREEAQRRLAQMKDEE